ncbi:MAG: FMN-binding protein [Treponema sp.]|jgi:uncharacterized protein with FMN-binding domain|nr:FMN-binding protein [Treponema sp.]
MKYVFISLLILAIVITGCAVLGGSRITASDGYYEGSGSGYRGPISVRVRVAGGNITEIEILESEEDHFVGGEAIEELLDLVILYNTTDIDAISGATESSRGFLEAVGNAILGK